MSHSTHVGFNEPPICSDRGREFLANVSGLAFPDRQSRDVGVANARLDTASISVPPSLDFRGVTRPPFVPSELVGVGHIGAKKLRGEHPADRSATAFVLLASGVGNNPQSVASVRGTNGGSRYAMPLRIVPERGHVSENRCKPSTKQRCDVLHDDEARSKLANQSGVLAP